jgi:hypothetical protein
MARELTALRTAARQHAALLDKREAELVAGLGRVANATTEAARTSAGARLGRATRRLADALASDRLVDAIALVDPVSAIAGLEPTHPIAMLPVRIETRFRRRTGGWDLLVRVYPDQIHTDGHEPRLTDIEAEHGARYWSAGADLEPAAWAELVRTYGPERAAWIRRSTAAGATDPGRTTTPYTRAPRTNLLPDRFWCVAYQGGTEVARTSGAPVRDPLAVGPDPTAALGPGGLDGGSAWLADFALAEQSGMALTLDLGSHGSGGVDVLLVYGVKASVTPADAATRLARVLDAHHYDDGLGFLRAGVATNNSSGHADAARSGWSTRDAAGADVSHQIECEPSAVLPADSSPAALARALATDGRRLAVALGVAPEHLAHVEGAGDTTELDARAMIVGLWPGVAGYGLRQFLSASVPEPLTTALRAHAVGWVRPRGPLPTLRVGRQPYGVLPATSLARFVPTADDDGSIAAMRSAMRKLVAVWLDAARSVPRMGVGDPAQAIAEILGLSPVSLGYRMRREADDQLLSVLGALAKVDERETEMLRTLHQGLLTTATKAIGRLSPADRLTGLVAFDEAPRLTRALVQTEPLSTSGGLVDNYIRFLRTGGAGDILDAPDRAGGPLLYLLLRASVLSQYLDDGSKLADLPMTRDELLDRFVAVDLPGRGPDGLLRDLLPKPPAGPIDQLGPKHAIGEVIRTVIERVGEEPVLQYDQPFGDGPTVLTRDGERAWPPPGATPGGAGASHPSPPPGAPGVTRTPARGDAGGGAGGTTERRFLIAGESSAAAARVVFDALPARAQAVDLGVVDLAAALAHLETLPSAVLDRLLRETLDLGGHRLDAWVTSLATQRLAEMRSSRDSGVHLGAFAFVHDLRPATPSGSGGFVHAPSVAHAVTAGVLRSGHLARGGTDELAIDLTSARVRVAHEILEGVRNGQRSGAILGALFERALTRRSGQAAIGPARTAAPLAGSIGAGAIPGACDGEALLRAVEDGSITAATIADGSGAPANERPALRTAVAAALDELADASDAVADLLMAESVHQLVARNLPRATAAMAATSGGRPPDEFDVDRIAPPGVGMSQKVAVLHRGSVPPVVTETVRALLDPFVDAWVATLLGPPASATLTVTFDDGSRRSVSLADTALAPLDVIALSAPATTGTVPQLVRILGDLAATAAGRRTIVSIDASSVERFARTARAVARVVGGARALDPSDVSGDVRVDVAAVRDRVLGALGYAERLLIDAERLSTTRDPDVAAVREGLDALLRAGVIQAVPVVPPGADRETALLHEQQQSAAAELRRRRDAAVAALPPGGATDVDAVTAYRAAATALVGEQAVLTLPLRATPLDAALDQPPAVGGGSVAERQAAARDLLRDAAAVRPIVAHVERMRQTIQGRGDPAPAVDLLQFAPDQPATEPWAGLGDPRRAATTQPAIAGGRTSVLTVDAALPADATASTMGLVLDEWSETVPAPVLTTALAVHANRPSNEAPQAIVLAVPPDTEAGWDQGVLEAVLLEAFDLARLRAVDLPALPTLGQLVPMLHLPLAGLSFNKSLRWHDLVRIRR